MTRLPEKTTVKWFKNWANEYDRTLGRVKRHHSMLDLAVRSARVKSGDQILDLGCGTGLLTLKFLKAADCRVTAVDNSPVMLDILKGKIKKLAIYDRVILKKTDARSLPFKEDSFDVVASTVVLHHVKDKYPVIKKIRNILKPGGRFILGDLDVDATGKLTDIKRISRVMDYLKDELILAAGDGGESALKRMFDNGKKHLFNEGEYCVSFDTWVALCRKSGFKKIAVKALPGFKWFKVMTAVK